MRRSNLRKSGYVRAPEPGWREAREVQQELFQDGKARSGDRAKVRPYLITLFLSLVMCAGIPLVAMATMEADPEVLYQQMKAAYDKAAAANWDYLDQEIYLSTIFNAGRAYSLQRPNDPALHELYTLTVQIGGSLHYDPLINHDAAVWYVREAAEWVSKNSEDPALITQAAGLLLRTNSEDDPEQLAQLSDNDAEANAARYPTNVDTQLQAVEANWRGWVLTQDPKWRSQAFSRATAENFPLAHLPTTWGPEFLRAVQGALDNGAGYTDDDRANARTIVTRIKALAVPLTIASVTVMPHDAYLTTLAPADEYFGPMGYSILGIENELKHINFMLDYNYGDREAAQTVQVAQSIDDMHKVYPRDIDMPKLLYSALTTLQRMDSPEAKTAAAHLRAILTVEYEDSPEARKVLTATTS